MTQKPNILLIVLDTLRRDRLSLYGHHRETSPELDTFASNATVFERAVSTAQWTVPAHASLFTGLYASTHQLVEADYQLSDRYHTLAEILHTEGYHTAGFCNNPLVGVLDNALQRGFMDFYNYAGAAPNRPFQTQHQGVRRMLSQRWQDFARVVSNQFAHREWLFRLSLHPLLTPIWTRYVNYKGHTGHSVDDVIAYLGQHHAGNTGPDRKPLFTFLNLMGTHLPYRPPQDALDRIAPNLRGDRHAYRLMGAFNADAARWASPAEPPISPEESRVIADFYDAEIVAQDMHLGRLLRYLKTSGALEDTMVIITADHGEGHGDHDFFGHSFVVYQELVHVPLIVHFPERFPPGKRVSTNVSTRRVFHTVLESAGIQPKSNEEDAINDIDRLSLARATNCQPDSEGGVAFAEAFPPQTFLGVMRHRNPHLIDSLRLTQVRRGVYDGQHKLAVVDKQVEGLFDIAADPAEISDVAQENPALVGDLQRKIDTFVEDTQSQRRDAAVLGGISDDMADHLRALGYLE